MNKLLRLIVLGTLFITPLFFLPITFEYFETPKAYLLIFSGFVAFITALFSQRDFLPFLRKLLNVTLWQLLVVFVLVLFITSFTGVDFWQSIVGSVNQKNGLLLLVSLTLFASVVAYLLHFKKITEHSVYQTLFYSFFTVAVIGILKSLLSKAGLVVFEGLFFDNREVSTLGQPNFFGFFTALAILFLPYFKSTKFKYVAYFILALATGLSFSKSAYILLSLNTILLLIANQNYNISKKYVTYFVIVFLILLNMAVVFTKTQSYKNFINSEQSYQYRRFTALATNPTSSESLRIVMLTAGVDAVTKRPILGYGKGHVDSAVYEKTQKTNLTKGQIVDSTHNFFLDIAIEGGLFSFALVLCIFALLAAQFAKEKDKTKLFMLLAITFNGLIHNTSNVTLMLIFLLVGMYDLTSTKQSY